VPSPFLVAEKEAKPQLFLDGFDSPGSAPPGREAPAAPKGPEPNQAIADAASSRSVPRIDPAQAKPRRELVVADAASSRSVPRIDPAQAKPRRELVVAHAATPKAKAAAPARRPPPASVAGKGEVQLAAAAAAAKAEKGKAEAIASKPGQGKGLAASDTKAGARGIKNGMYVQVGAFGSRSNAEQLRKRLSKELARLQVQVRSIGGDDAQLYKVQVGPLASRAKASDVSHQLAALGVKKSHVIVE
jgi:rare lipoprotein A